MTSTNDPSKCSGCDCSFEQKAIVDFLVFLFPVSISKIIIHKTNSSSEYRITHSNQNGPPHALCPDCEEYWEDLMCRMDTNTFTCPHSGCQRYIIAG